MMKALYRTVIVIFAALALFSSCVKEESFGNVESGIKANMDFDVISARSATAECVYSSEGKDTISIDFCVEASSKATKLAREQKGESNLYTCAVSVTGCQQGNNCLTGSDTPATKSVQDQNSIDEFACNFLRIDEDSDSDHTALYTFRTWNRAKLLEGQVTGSPDDHSGKYYRTVTFVPEQSYKYYAKGNDTIFYHSRIVGFHPQLCSLPTDKNPVEFGETMYENFRSYVNGKYGVVFNHALDGETDVMMSNLGEAQRWHSSAAPSSGNDNRYRDMKKELFDDKYRQPFGYNYDQAPHYENPVTFKHYLSAVRIWAKVDPGASESQGVLNLSTWGSIEALTFVGQPSTCTVMMPETVGSYGDTLSGSWNHYTNFSACCSYLYGSSEVTHPVQDYTVTYPIDMTSSSASMTSKYLGYCLVKPGEDVTIAIQTAAGTYQAIIPSAVEGGEDLFQSGKIYDITLNLKTKGSVSDFIGNENTAYYEDLSPWDTDDSEFKTANCYIIDSAHVAGRLAEYKSKSSDEVPGFCFVGTIIGNGETGILSKGTATFHTSTATVATPASAKIVWQSRSGLISNVHLQHGYVRFLVPKAVKGNAVIATLDEEGNIVWSWHIWITDTPKDVTTDYNYTFMDRNLGAISTSDNGVVPNSSSSALKLYGMYYQWGRKDPFPWPAKYNQTGGQSMRITPVYNTYNEEVNSLGMYLYNQGETIEDGIRHPMHILINPGSSYYNYNWMGDKIDFLWGEEYTSGGEGDTFFKKSIYDPCPRGYHVPTEEIQYLLEHDATKVSTTYGLSLLSGKLFLPYAGYYGPDRNQSANDAAAYYCGSKGDYQSCEICSDEDGIDNPYFRYHRLRSYISDATSWTESYVDGQSSFEYSAGDHYVVTTSVTTGHDYTNRRTAASVRCVKNANYKMNVMSSIQASTLKVSTAKDTDVEFTLTGYTNKGQITSAQLKIYYLTSETDTTWADPINLIGQSGITSTSKTLTGTYTYEVLSSQVSAAYDNIINARMDITATQGGVSKIGKSNEVHMSNNAVLDIIYDAEGKDSEMVDSYTSEGVRVIKFSTMYPPVVGQGTTINVYVNSNTETTVTVTADGKNYEATLQSSTSYIVRKGEKYYRYQATGVTFSSKGDQPTTVTATRTGYKKYDAYPFVRVYGIVPGTALSSTSGQSIVTQNTTDNIYENWYVFLADNKYNCYDGTNLTYGSTLDYSCLFGFTSNTATTKIQNAAAGMSKYASGKSGGTTVIMTESTSDTDYELSDYNCSSGFLRIQTGSIWVSWVKWLYFWHKENNVFKCRQNLNYDAAEFEIKPVTFSYQ